MSDEIHSLQKQRNIVIDILKTTAIILVVFGHCIQYGSGKNYLANDLFYENRIFKTIYSFHMPLFMLISGYLFSFSVNKVSWIDNIKNKAKTFLVPACIWGSLFFAVQNIKSFDLKTGFAPIRILKNYLLSMPTQLWFFWALFASMFIVVIVNKFFKDKCIIYLLGLILCFFIPDISFVTYFKFVFPFFLIGYFFNQKNLSDKYRKIINSPLTIIITLVLFVFFMVFYNHNSYIYTSKFCIIGNNKNSLEQLIIDIYRFCVGLFGSALVILVTSKISKHLEKKTKLVAYIVCISKNTFGIYVISTYLNTVLKYITSNLPNINYPLAVFETFVMMFLTLGITMLIRKSDLLNKLLLGGRK